MALIKLIRYSWAVVWNSQIFQFASHFFLKLKMEEIEKFVYIFTISNAELDINPIVFVIELAVKNLIIW